LDRANRFDCRIFLGKNGSGKSTLIKVMIGLYTPDSGAVLVDGSPLSEWDIDAWRNRVGVILQGYAKYKLTVGDNISAGDGDRVLDRKNWERAAKSGLAEELITDLPDSFVQRLGRQFGGLKLRGV
jgi:ABC-type multidrug transport system fused ATPase/permease subunit